MILKLKDFQFFQPTPPLKFFHSDIIKWQFPYLTTIYLHRIQKLSEALRKSKSVGRLQFIIAGYFTYFISIPGHIYTFFKLSIGSYNQFEIRWPLQISLHDHFFPQKYVFFNFFLCLLFYSSIFIIFSYSFSYCLKIFHTLTMTLLVTIGLILFKIIRMGVFRPTAYFSNLLKILILINMSFV